ncbi:unnamed protein product [Oncorhynchus mykiss]|uniref:Uncharacterized protein n=1 Tax=Oncorhynchus mykiss TaxID=8022 RepID=A0A060WXY5_ONCMY|nr:unnamed protein product [Oncorhynchus mykiss]
MLQRKSCECEMAEIIDHEGSSHLYCNARHRGHRVEALSESSGVYFDKPRLAPRLVEPCHGGCQGSVIGFPAPEQDTQTWLLFTHPTNKRTRKDLGVYLNRSPLHTSGWDRPWIVHSGPSGYSDLAYIEDTEHFACLMECGENSELEQIAFVSFPLSDVMQTVDEKGNTFYEENAMQVILPSTFRFMVQGLSYLAGTRRDQFNDNVIVKCLLQNIVVQTQNTSSMQMCVQYGNNNYS